MDAKEWFRRADLNKEPGNVLLWGASGDALDFFYPQGGIADAAYLDPPRLGNSGWKHYAIDEGSRLTHETVLDPWQHETQATASQAREIRAHNAKLARVLSEFERDKEARLLTKKAYPYLIQLVHTACVTYRMLEPKAAVLVHIDPAYLSECLALYKAAFGRNSFRGMVTYPRHTTHNDTTNSVPQTQEFLAIYFKDGETPPYFEWAMRPERPEDYKRKRKTNVHTGERERCRSLLVSSSDKLKGDTYKVTIDGHEYPTYVSPKQIQAYRDEGRLRWDGHALDYVETDADEPYWQRLQDHWPDIGKTKNPIIVTQKPDDLCRRVVRMIVPPGGTILDPFLGGAGILRAAHELERKCIGVECSWPILERTLPNLLDTLVSNLGILVLPRDLTSAQNLAALSATALERWWVGEYGLEWIGPLNLTGDGLGHFQDGGKIHDILAEVKSGSPTIHDFRSFCGILVERDAIGLWLQAAGPPHSFYEHSYKLPPLKLRCGQLIPRVQIITLPRYFEGLRGTFPPGVNLMPIRPAHAAVPTDTINDLFPNE